MNQLISLESVFVDNDKSWPSTLEYINQISKQCETCKILDCLWNLSRGSGSTGLAFYLTANINNAHKVAGVKVYRYGSALEINSEICRRYHEVSGTNSTDIEVVPSESRDGSIITCPVFGPYSSKGLFIVHYGKSPDKIMNSELEALNYILLKSQIYIAEIEAKQKIEAIALSKREIQVLEQLIRGESNKAIAENLGVSVHTVNGYVRLMMLKLNVKDRVSACMIGLSIL